MTLPKRICELPGCDFEIITTDVRKRFCCKQHADRSRNLIYRVPAPPKYEHIKDLRHFARLTDAGKRAVLLGEGPFSVVMFDIECTHLKANIGRMICCSFKPLGGKPYTFHALERGTMKPDVYDDSVLAERIRVELERYDIIVGWNSRMFDVRYINARLVRADKRIKKAQYHIDGMWAWATKMAAWKGLDSVQQFVIPGGKKKTPIAWPQWMRVLGWNKALREEALADIVRHCERDVVVLEEVYRLLAREGVIRAMRVDGGML